MHTSIIALPKVHIAEKNTGVNVLIYGSLYLAMPSGYEHLVTADGLLQTVKEQHLWVARTGACQLMFSLSSQDEAIDINHVIDYLAEWIYSWDVRLQLSY